jgi:serine/threonine protein phosphatase 1
MAERTIAIGDIHGDLSHLEKLFGRLPRLDAGDTLVFLGDYVDRGPDSAGVVEFVRRRILDLTPARLIALRGSHEDAWLRVRREGWFDFILPIGNGCLASLRSFTGGPPPAPGEVPTIEEYRAMERAAFFPDDVVTWMESLPCYYEDEHALYVHAGLAEMDGRWLHPSEMKDPRPLMWQRSADFFKTYRGKRVVFGHTATEYLPQELSFHTPNDGKDVFIDDHLVGIDTGCGRNGHLSAVELPRLVAYESRGA